MCLQCGAERKAKHCFVGPQLTSAHSRGLPGGRTLGIHFGGTNPFYRADKHRIWVHTPRGLKVYLTGNMQHFCYLSSPSFNTILNTDFQ